MLNPTFDRNKRPMHPTGCGNYNCPIRTGCDRANTHKFHFTNMFKPSRLADGRVSCAMRIEGK